MNIKLSHTDREAIVAALQSGKTTTAELSSKYGISRSHVTVVYRKETGTKLRPVKRLSQSDKEAIVAELLAKKVMVGELAARYGVTPSAISYVFKKKVGKPHRPYPRWKLSSQEKEIIVAELGAKKATIKELASRFQVPGYAISKIFRKQTGKSFGAPHVPGTVKEAIIAEIRTNETVTKQELAAQYKMHIGTLGRIIKQITGKTFRSLRPRPTTQISLTTHTKGIQSRRPKLSLNDKETIVAALQSGKKPKELGIKYGVSSSYISYLYKQETGTIFRKPPRLSQSDKQSIVSEIQAKKITMTELAKRYGVDQTTISHVFKNMTGSALQPLLSQSDRTNIVAELLAGKATMRELATKYKVSYITIIHTFKRQTGKSLTEYKYMLNRALQESEYRAWHKQEKHMYPVLGVDWFNAKILIHRSQELVWLGMSLFVLLKKSTYQDRKRTPEYPEGQEICAGDIVQLPINLDGKKTIVKSTVTFDRELGMFILPEVDEDPLSLNNDECEIIGTIYENPELMREAP